jgi:ABC-type phosphate/phosphonate transport system substrate-binding protein
MNPQLRKQLRVLAASPRLVTNLFAFHKNYSKEGRDLVTAALLDVHRTEVGRQALTLFQGNRIVPASPSALDSALELLRRYDRLKGRLGEAKP